MKIYFEDGSLAFGLRYSRTFNFVLEANDGVTSNIKALDYHAEHNPNITIYTNSIFALHSRYAWNEALNVPEIFIRAGEAGKWVRIDKLTNRTLKPGHNLAKMYVAGEFEKKRSTYSES